MRVPNQGERPETLEITTAGPDYAQPRQFLYLGGSTPETSSLTVAVVLQAIQELYNRPSAQLDLNIRMLKTDLIKTLLYGIRRQPSNDNTAGFAPLITDQIMLFGSVLGLLGWESIESTSPRLELL